MKTYAAIKAEIAELEKQADEALRQERAGVISRIKEAIKVYGFTAQDLGFGGNSKSSSKRRPASKRKATATSTTVGVAKYRDPESGKTWTGRGKPPNWIAAAKDREAYLIRPDSGSGASLAASKRASAVAKGPRAQRKAGGGGDRRRNGAKKVSRPARQATVPPAVQLESGAATS